MVKLRAMTLVLCAGIGLAAASLPASAFAQAEAQSSEPLEQARQLAKDGLAAYQAGDYAKALELFEQARKLYPSTQIVRMEGYSLLALERWSKAADALDTALAAQSPPLGAADRKEVEEQLAKAMLHLGMLDLKSNVAGAQVVIDDGDPVALPLAKPLRLPIGTRKIAVRAPGHEEATDQVLIEPSKTVDLTLNLAPTGKAAPPPPPQPVKPQPPPPPPPAPKKGWFPHQRAIGIAAAGTGLALGGAAIATALAGARIRSNVEGDVALHFKNFGQNCDLNDYRLCVFDRAIINQDADRADSLRNASIGLAAGAGALAATGMLFIIFAGSDAPQAAPDQKASAKHTGRRALFCGPMAMPGVVCAGSF